MTSNEFPSPSPISTIRLSQNVSPVILLSGMSLNARNTATYSQLQKTQTDGSLVKVLLVEDNETNRLLLEDYLSYCGYEVRCLADGGCFGQAVSAFKPDIILLDLKLPKIDGYTLLSKLKQHPQWATIPVIVISALAFNADRKRALNLGAKHYLVKPVQLEHVLQLIRQETA